MNLLSIDLSFEPQRNLSIRKDFHWNQFIFNSFESIFNWFSFWTSKKSIDKKGFQLESIYFQFINLLSIDFSFEPQRNLLIRKGFNWNQFTFNSFESTFNWFLFWTSKKSIEKKGNYSNYCFLAPVFPSEKHGSEKKTSHNRGPPQTNSKILNNFEKRSTHNRLLIGVPHYILYTIYYKCVPMFFLFSDGCHVGYLDQVLLESKLPPAPTSAERLKRKRIYVGSTLPYHTLPYHNIPYHAIHTWLQSPKIKHPL